MRSDGIQGSGHVDTNPIFQNMQIPSTRTIFLKITPSHLTARASARNPSPRRVPSELSACTNKSAADLRLLNDLHTRFRPIPRLG